jgi:ferritin-like metal-binding protein YciE
MFIALDDENFGILVCSSAPAKRNVEYGMKAHFYTTTLAWMRLSAVKLLSALDCQSPEPKLVLSTLVTTLLPHRSPSPIEGEQVSAACCVNPAAREFESCCLNLRHNAGWFFHPILKHHLTSHSKELRNAYLLHTAPVDQLSEQDIHIIYLEPTIQGRNAMEMESLRDLFIEELKDLYSAENQIVKALPKMIKKAASRELKSGFEQHLKETQVHVERLEKIFQELDESPRGKKCKGMEGVIADGKEWMEEDAEPEVMDAGLIGAAQRVEHYEMAGYGCVRTYAELLGHSNFVDLLQQTLDEEKATDEKLTQLARKINVQAEKAA